MVPHKESRPRRRIANGNSRKRELLGLPGLDMPDQTVLVFGVSWVLQWWLMVVEIITRIQERLSSPYAEQTPHPSPPFLFPPRVSLNKPLLPASHHRIPIVLTILVLGYHTHHLLTRPYCPPCHPNYPRSARRFFMW